MADPEKANSVRGHIQPSNFILFDDGRLKFANIAGAEEVKSSAVIKLHEEGIGDEDLVTDMKASGLFVLSMCTREDTKSLENDCDIPISGLYSKTLQDLVHQLIALQ